MRKVGSSEAVPTTAVKLMIRPVLIMLVFVLGHGLTKALDNLIHDIGCIFTRATFVVWRNFLSVTHSQLAILSRWCSNEVKESRVLSHTAVVQDW